MEKLEPRTFPTAAFPEGPFLKVEDITNIPSLLYQIFFGIFYDLILFSVEFLDFQDQRNPSFKTPHQKN